MVQGASFFKSGNYSLMIFKDAIWIKIFYHNMSNLEGFFTENEALNTSSEYKYSILGSIDDIKRYNHKYEFIIEYPELGTYNRWIQAKNPLTILENSSNEAVVDGFEKIETLAPSPSWGGLCKTVPSESDLESGPPSLLNGSPNVTGSNLYMFAVGVYNGTSWLTGPEGNKTRVYTIPSNSGPVNEEILWMRVYQPIPTRRILDTHIIYIIFLSQIMLSRSNKI